MSEEIVNGQRHVKDECSTCGKPLPGTTNFACIPCCSKAEAQGGPWFLDMNEADCWVLHRIDDVGIAQVLPILQQENHSDYSDRARKEQKRRNDEHKVLVEARKLSAFEKHVKEAEEYLDRSHGNLVGEEEYTRLSVARAQVHATLALAQAVKSAGTMSALGGGLGLLSIFGRK